MSRYLVGWAAPVWALLLGVAALAGQNPTPPPEVRDLFDLEREYIRARGGRVLMDETRTAMIRGRFLQDETVVTFQSYRRRPNLYRLDFTLAGTDVREGFDGTVAWRVLPRPDGRQVERLEGEAAVRLQREAEFESPLVSHGEKSARLTYRGLETVGERSCHALTVERRGAAREHWFLDAETFLEVESHREATDGKHVITRFHDWRRVDGRAVAHRVETFHGDQLVSVTIIDRVQWNLGVLSDVFRVPE